MAAAATRSSRPSGSRYDRSTVTKTEPPDAKPKPILARIAAIGAAAQASVPGLYAWVVTVEPIAWSRGAQLLAKIAAIAGIASLVAGIVVEQRSKDERDRARARHVSVWGLTLTSAVVWMLTPAALAPLRFDAPRGVAGLLGWGLFAFVSAAPALQRDDATSPVVSDAPPLAPRSTVRRGDILYIAGAVVAAVALQAVGWRTPAPERALLVRLVTVSAGLALIGAATQISLARHERLARMRVGQRFRGALPWIVLLVLLLGGAAVVALR
jgi:hypothetical protein